MPKRQAPEISLRKQPKQARSADLVTVILDAAVQVLEAEGAQRFTTARVADRAGVSVGSLYQYFPNKAAILFRLQLEEWQQTTDMLRAILKDPSIPPMSRLRNLVHAFIRSECEEAAVRGALSDAAPLYRDAPETQAARARGQEIYRVFIAEILPGFGEERRETVQEIVTASLSELGRRFSEQSRTDREIRDYSDALADMLVAYLESLNSF
ncbi:MAG: TetR/AcrR family transcriptional regulator [Alphaproteobacteria bacterium]|nr:MAG: TetR/AcrR family transcriptional regulator [Alphaproteobacteria bacterium]